MQKPTFEIEQVTFESDDNDKDHYRFSKEVSSLLDNYKKQLALIEQKVHQHYQSEIEKIIEKYKDSRWDYGITRDYIVEDLNKIII